MLDEYIKELIANNNRVIIPNFGAFLLRATSKNKNKKELSEKIDDIYFSPFLKFNDELLVNHIIQKEGSGQKEAMDKINEYIRNIEEKVKNEGVYTIEGLGEFHIDDQGKVQFKVYSAAAPEEPAKTKKSPPKKETEAQSKTINEKAAQNKKTAEESGTESSGEAEPAKSSKTQKAGAAKQPAKDKSPAKGKTEASKVKSGGGKKTPPPPPKQKEKAGASKGDNNRGLILSIAIGVPVAIVFIWAMLNFDTVQGLFDRDERPEGPTEETRQPMVGEQEEPEKDKPEEAQQQQETTADQKEPQKKASQEGQPSAGQSEEKEATQATKKYYIVAGSFKKKQNAVSFRRKLLDQGYKAEMIGERNGMHAVSYASFKNKSQAQAELRRLRNEKGVTAWLLYY